MQGILSSLVRTHSFLAILAATLCGSVSAQASLQQAAPDPTGATCNYLYNGGFDNGFARWNVTPCTGAFGDARPFTGASVIQVPVAGQMENVASLSASAFLDAVDSKTTGSGVQGQVTMSRDALLTHRVLRFTLRGGGYGICTFGEPMGRFLAKVVVTNTAGLKAEQTFVRRRASPVPGSSSLRVRDLRFGDHRDEEHQHGPDRRRLREGPAHHDRDHRQLDHGKHRAVQLRRSRRGHSSRRLPPVRNRDVQLGDGPDGRTEHEGLFAQRGSLAGRPGIDRLPRALSAPTASGRSDSDHVAAHGPEPPASGPSLAVKSEPSASTGSGGGLSLAKHNKRRSKGGFPPSRPQCKWTM